GSRHRSITGRIREMGLLPLLAVLVTVAAGRSTVAVELVHNLDRIVTTCTEDRMIVELRRDLDKFSMHGDEPECQPVLGNGTDAYGQEIITKTWSLPLREDAAPCALKFARVRNTKHKAFTTTLHGVKESREVSCMRTGMLDKRGAQIKLDVVNGPKIQRLAPSEGEEVVEVTQRATVRASFSSNFPKTADISLHPLTCWLVDDTVLKRWLVIDKGCPIEDGPVVIGSEDADAVSGEHPHVFFNAEQGLFEGQNATTRFRLQCSVFPCKGHPLARQIIGVERCPPVAWCQTKRRRIETQPKGLFDIDQLFSLEISPTEVVDFDRYRPLFASPIYPGHYWPVDTEAADLPPPPPSSALSIYIIIASIIVLPATVIGVWIAIKTPLQRFLKKQWVEVEQMQVYPEKSSISMNDSDHTILVLKS
ncbi:hypothetical protein PFISCL1PPCAC_22651, partial [Pristionchus fissidentatus]